MGALASHYDLGRIYETLFRDYDKAVHHYGLAKTEDGIASPPALLGLAGLVERGLAEGGDARAGEADGAEA